MRKLWSGWTWQHIAIGVIISLAMLGYAAVKPTKENNGNLKGYDWTFEAIGSTDTVANAAGASFDISGLPDFCYFVYISSAATITPKYQARGSTNWLPGNAITVSGIYTDEGYYGAAKVRWDWIGNDDTIEVIVGAKPIKGREPAR